MLKIVASFPALVGVGIITFPLNLIRKIDLVGCVAIGRGRKGSVEMLSLSRTNSLLDPWVLYCPLLWSAHLLFLM
jgi:hypothetical protein